MGDETEPPSKNIGTFFSHGSKKLILDTSGMEHVRPHGMAKPFIRRKGITNAAGAVRGNEVTLLGRLIYEDPQGDNSAILKYNGDFNNGDIEIFPETERVLFPPHGPWGKRGVEDFRLAKVKLERPYHGFLVHHDGRDARTEYIRTTERDPFDLTDWIRFGIWFPNIKVGKAIDLVKQPRYKERWASDHATSEHLGTKDCSLWPEKVKRPGPDGPETEYYGVPIRLLPDMQIVYVRDFNELARREFWQDVVRDLDDHVLLERKYDWEKSHIGLAGQPMIVDEGVLMFYHGAVMEPERIYRFGAALVDRADPQKVIARTRVPLIEPTESWESRQGVVSGKVVFPTEHINLGDGRIGHFYGASDDCIGWCVTPLSYIYNRMESV